MADHTQPFKERMKCNDAEKKFEQFCSERDIKFYKYGIDNHPFGAKFYKVKRLIRNTPDYIVLNDVASFIEVKGFKGKLKMKEKDVNSYKFWNSQIRLYYFFYSVTHNETKFVLHDDLMEVVPLCETGYYDDNHRFDNKMYYIIPWRKI